VPLIVILIAIYSYNVSLENSAIGLLIANLIIWFFVAHFKLMELSVPGDNIGGVTFYLFISVIFPAAILISAIVLFFKIDLQLQDKYDLNSSLTQIESNFTDFHDNLNKEKDNLEIMMKNISIQVNSQNQIIKRNLQYQEELQTKIAHYENLLNLSDKEVKAINKQLNGNGIINYLISFIIGFLSSLMVWVTSIYIEKRKKVKTTEPNKVHNDHVG